MENAINLIPEFDDFETESIMKPMFKTMKGEVIDLTPHIKEDKIKTPRKKKKKKKPKKIRKIKKKKQEKESTVKDVSVENSETTSE